MEHVQRVLDVSQRRVCKVMGLPRSTARYLSVSRDRDEALTKAMLNFAQKYPRYGYRRITAILRREGWRVNRKRVYRLWCQEHLKVVRKQRKRRHLGSGENACHRYRPQHKDHVWCYDFTNDRTENGRSLKFLAILDEYTRECLALEVGRSFTGAEVVGVLKYLFEVRGEPKHIRSDNGTEFMASVVRRHLAASGVKTLYIDPGSPWQNGYSESFNRRLEDELLKREIFTGVVEAQQLAERWRQEYNHRRPHSALGYETPAAFAARCVGPDSAALRPEQHTQRTMESCILGGT